MAGVACIRDFEYVGLHRCHKMKRMTASARIMRAARATLAPAAIAHRLHSVRPADHWLTAGASTAVPTKSRRAPLRSARAQSAALPVPPPLDSLLPSLWKSPAID